MIPKTIFAYTEPTGNFPAFANISEVDPNEKGKRQFKITVQQRGASVPAEIVISVETLLALSGSIERDYGCSAANVPADMMPPPRDLSGTRAAVTKARK